MDLTSLYTQLENNPAAFSSIKSLYKSAQEINPNIKIQDIKNFLKGQKSYTLHKSTFKKFPRRKIIAPHPKVIASSDLADMAKLGSHNSGHKYLLVVIDIFSRYAQVIPLKKKTASHTLEGLKQILDSEPFQGISRLNTDEGKEYYNRPVKEYLKSKGITLYSTFSREIKASIAERFIRTLKGKLYRYMTHHNTLSYLPQLPNIVSNYNNSLHRILKSTPTQVHHSPPNSKYITNLFTQMYKNPHPTPTPLSSLLDIGQHVRIADEGRNKPFRRGYSVQNTWEIFKIKSINTSQFPPTYTLVDLQEEPILGVFYREELVLVDIPTSFDIDIIKTKKVGSIVKHYVSWRGYPPQFNSWIKDSDIVRPV